ncbi:hypothetical protein [Wolbachia endosymbiont (group E) of Neria commutata]|uniref:hypothetical protein n=1 Tax=Wolbachia endosymbiont (group E) of Neria commutata TaxID=3066149 RepID=UPI003132CB8C
MKYYIGLDVSLKETFISIVDEKRKIRPAEKGMTRGRRCDKRRIEQIEVRQNVVKLP